MALDNYIGWSQAEKILLMRGLQEARNTGQVTRVQTSPGVFTEFNPVGMDMTKRLRDVESSIAYSLDYDEDDPVQLACYNNIRTGKVMTIHSSYPRTFEDV